MTIFDEPPLRDELRTLARGPAPEFSARVRLDHTTNPYPLPEVVAEAVEKAVHGALRDVHRYPDPQAVALREDLAAYLGNDLSAANIAVANGANEAMLHVMLAFGGPGRTAMGFAPSYPGYARLARSTGASWLDGHRGVGFGITVEAARAQVRVYQPDVAFVCSPNNPTGAVLGLDTIRAVLEETPGMVVVDETFMEFARPGAVTAATLLAHYPRLVVVRSLSRAFGLAGARLGYLAARPAVVEALALVRQPYHLSALTQAAGRAVLANIAPLAAQVEAIKKQRERMIAGLREMGMMVVDSDANFVLFGPSRDQRSVWQALMERGILVRDMGLPGYLRVSIGTPDQNNEFLAAMGSLKVRP